MVRYRKAIDANQGSIRDAIEFAGWLTLDTHQCGYGVPDLIAWKDELRVWIEVKMPGKNLTPAEEKMHKWLPGMVLVVHGSEEAIDLLDLFERRLALVSSPAVSEARR